MSADAGLTLSLLDNSHTGFRVIEFRGCLDENTSEIARVHLEALTQGADFKNLVFDLSNLGYINSKGIGFLVSVHAHTSKNQQKLVLVNPNEEVSDVLTLVGIDTIIDTFGTLEEAYQTLGVL